MRAIRLVFVFLVAVVLIGVALANRQMITISLFPAQFGQYLGGNWSLTLPAFLALFVAVLFGVLIGFLWEWLREASIRAKASRQKQELSRLEREVQQLRQEHAAPKDEVLAILSKSSTTGNGSSTAVAVTADPR